MTALIDGGAEYTPPVLKTILIVEKPVMNQAPVFTGQIEKQVVYLRD